MRLERYLAGFVGLTEAQDIAQQVFVKILEGHRPANDDPWPWIKRVGANLAIDHLRSQSSRVRREHVVLDRPVTLDRETVLCVRDALTKLPQHERAAVVASAAGHSGGSLATVLGRSTDGAQAVLCRARKHLRAILEPALLPAWILVSRVRNAVRQHLAPHAEHLAAIGQTAAAIVAIGIASAFTAVIPGPHGSAPTARAAIAIDERPVARSAGMTRRVAGERGMSSERMRPAGSDETNPDVVRIESRHGHDEDGTFRDERHVYVGDEHVAGNEYWHETCEFDGPTGQEIQAIAPVVVDTWCGAT